MYFTRCEVLDYEIHPCISPYGLRPAHSNSFQTNLVLGQKRAGMTTDIKSEVDLIFYIKFKLSVYGLIFIFPAHLTVNYYFEN